MYSLEYLPHVLWSLKESIRAFLVYRISELCLIDTYNAQDTRKNMKTNLYHCWSPFHNFIASWTVISFLCIYKKGRDIIHVRFNARGSQCACARGYWKQLFLYSEAQLPFSHCLDLNRPTLCARERKLTWTTTVRPKWNILQDDTISVRNQTFAGKL